MKVMMVCLGNICRSPIAEGILKHLVAKQQLDWEVTSSGTSGFHNGELPHKDSIDISSKHHIDITDQRSSKFNPLDLDYYDIILAMDTSNYNDILRVCKTEAQEAKVELILNYAYPEENRAVPDPYYEGGFDKVFHMIYVACEKIIENHR